MRNNRMRSKILIVCICCTLVALILQTILFQRASGSLIYNQAKKENYRTLENMQNEIYTFVKNIESNMIEIYNNKDFLRDIKKADSVQDLQEKYYRLAYEIATNQFSTSDGVVAIYIYDIHDQIISNYRRAATPKHNYPKDIYENPAMYNAFVVQDYVESGQTSMLISSYYNIHREKNIARFVLKLYDSTNLNDKIGYIVCDIDVKSLSRIMEKYVSDAEMYVWLQPVGDRQIVATGTLENENEDYYQSIDKLIQNGKDTQLDSTEDPAKALFQVNQDKYNLSAFSIMPQAILRQNQKILNQNLLLIVLVMSTVMILLYSYITQSLTRQLENLTRIISRIRGGETDLRFKNAASDEIGQLGTEFNEMLDEMEKLIGQQYEDKLLINQAEYKALQAQINPHFLYNTLDTMSSIASVQNCELVSNLCQSLSSIFRYSLDIKQPYSTVAKEIMHLKNFIYVMNVRMPEEIKYEFDIEDGVLQDTIPRISLQPIVENALKHGLKNKYGDKWIRILAKEEAGLLYIGIEDNGVGMDAGEINERLRRNDRGHVEEGKSIGLYNINARLKMLYGDEYGVRIESMIGEGTRVIMEIPQNKGVLTNEQKNV